MAQRARVRRFPEILGIGEDRTDVPRRRGGGRSSPSDILSVYFEGGPRYRLGERTYRFEPPVGILIPQGTRDEDRQEGKVGGVFALFHGRGLLRDSGGASGVEVAVVLGDRKLVVPCLKELEPRAARSIADRLAEIRSVRDARVGGRLRRTGLLLQAVADYCTADARAGRGAVHRAAAQLRELVDELAFENISMERIYDKLDISAAHAGVLFREAYGVAPGAYRGQLRFRRARELLVSSQMNVSEVAYAVGFTDPLYFSRVFRKAFGLTPSSLIRDFAHKRKLMA